MRSLWALDHALSERARGVSSRFGITATQRLVVRILGQTPGTSAGSVSRILHVHPSTLSPVLHQLVSRGLVRRTADPEDRRRAVLWLTARGERVDAATAADVDDRIRSALGRMAASEVFHASRVINALSEALAAGEETPTRGVKSAPGKRRARGEPRPVRKGARAQPVPEGEAEVEARRSSSGS
jgi:DNA-binding MarR family transcriptional regulator